MLYSVAFQFNRDWKKKNQGHVHDKLRCGCIGSTDSVIIVYADLFYGCIKIVLRTMHKTREFPFLYQPQNNNWLQWSIEKYNCHIMLISQISTFIIAENIFFILMASVEHPNLKRKCFYRQSSGETQIEAAERLLDRDGCYTRRVTSYNLAQLLT